jgi:polyphenol oxidase
MLKSSDLITPNWPAPANVKALQSTRTGGISLEPYNSLNLGSHVNDNPIHVAQNRQLLSQFLPSEPVWLNQVHGVSVVDAAQTTCIPDADASFTTHKNVVCVTMTADCLPILLCDTAGTLVSSIHAGWRSLCDGVIEATVEKLLAKPADLMAWLGPAIGPNAFEVGGEVREQFMAKDAKAELAFKTHGDNQEQNKWLCDIDKIATQRLNNLGITQIYGGGIDQDFCTFTEKDQFFSFRRDGVTGRMATLIWLE